MKKLIVLFIAGIGVMAAGAVHAADTLKGDAERGKTRAAACAACHGADGNGMAGMDAYPKLAGQVSGYIAKQLKAFKDGSRKDPIMAGMAAPLSDQDMADLDAFYASLPVKNIGIASNDKEQALAGEKIYRGGYAKMNISACMSCHGPAGKGIPVQYPRLSGQNAAYIEKQLHAFKDGTRQDPMMNPISFLLSSEQIKQLSLYVQGLK
jgi:cytochrome c553